MRKFGLIGYPLTHSFSKKYFSDKFTREGKNDCLYDLYEIANITDLPSIIDAQKELIGINVTIPYKEQVIPYLDNLDPACAAIGAVNCIKLTPQGLVGYNTDYYGFKTSLSNWLGAEKPKALILGTGGASKAVCQALDDLNIPFLKVSRNPDPSSKNTISYEAVKASPDYLSEYPLIINTTPLGTFPNVSAMPDLPVSKLNKNNWYYDLVYNPTETAMMTAAEKMGAKTKNGIEMLHLQAEAAWEIWNR
ncbi:shikimate dehydrogenase [uncultured Cyclobacterium sp.]|mgnify:FL=1|uniref:shikimate dehydrogenase family protein n=1 Tax=uncultured Cyclobacterium sp. TaxID=453820 RepID=UPI0030EEF5C3|tara:strand:- start:45151 stop:45897 length:747 start_codon:yes stop_codon:yes gene_type:complete